MEKEIIEQTVENFTKGKELYFIIENGWYYSKTINAFPSYAEALDFLNETEESLMEKINKSYHTEGFWYYSIEKRNFLDLINELIGIKAEEEVQKQINYTVKKGNEHIFYNGYKEAKKENADLLKGIAYLIEKNGYLLNCFSLEEKKKSFENLKK